MDSALVIPAHLPPRLEQERRLRVSNAPLGVPAHLTLLYPFVAPADLTDADRELIARILDQHPAFDYQLGPVRGWPTVLYLEVQPVAPFARLVEMLTQAYPERVPYNGDFPYVPHVTIAEVVPADSTQLADPVHTPVPRPGRPLRRRAEQAILIVQDQEGRWHTRWRFSLGGSERRSVDSNIPKQAPTF